MADFKFSRDARKRRLKDSIINRNDDTGEGKKRPSLLVYVIIVLAVAALAYGVYYYLNYTLKNEYSVAWFKEDTMDTESVETFRGFESFAGGIIKYTKDGAVFTDSRGNVVWERSYQLNTPIISTSESYAVIADQGSTSIFIFDDKTITGVSETILPISLVRIADNGVVYAVLNDSDAEYITAFRPDGTAIDLSVKSIISGDGYPFDADTSPDGTQLLTSYACIENGQIVNNVVFRNFGSVGQNADARRIVGGFKDEFAGHFAGRVHFATNVYSQAFYDGGVVFFSTKVLNTPEVLANVSFTDRMMQIGYSSSFSAVMLESPDSSLYGRLETYSNSGAKLGEAAIDFKYKDICVSGDSVIVYDGSHIRVYSKKCALRGEFDFTDGEITKIIGGGKNNAFYVVTSTEILKITF